MEEEEHEIVFEPVSIKSEPDSDENESDPCLLVVVGDENVKETPEPDSSPDSVWSVTEDLYEVETLSETTETDVKTKNLKKSSNISIVYKVKETLRAAENSKTLTHLSATIRYICSNKLVLNEFIRIIKYQIINGLSSQFISLLKCVYIFSVIIKCFKCDQVFLNLARLSEHMKWCKKYQESRFKNNYCEETCEYPSGSKSQHRNIFECDMCGYLTDSDQNFAEHIKFHKQETILVNCTTEPTSSYVSYKCLACGKVYRDTDKLNAHLENHNLRDSLNDSPNSSNENVHNYCCKLCGKLFKTEKQLAYHKSFHNHLQRKKCPIVLKNKATLNKHTWLQYKNPRNKKETITLKYVLCTTCGKGYNNSEKLKEHRFTHLVTMPAKCKVCGYVLTTYKQAMEHAEVHGSSNLYPVDKSEKSSRRYTCKECNTPFVHYSILLKHLKTNHGIIQEPSNPISAADTL